MTAHHWRSTDRAGDLLPRPHCPFRTHSGSILEGSTVTRYGFGGPGDGPAFVLNTSNAVTQRMIGLLGGASVTKQGAGDVWSYPNLHGDVIATASAAGAKQGATLTYDPFGVGTAPDNAEGNLDYGNSSDMCCRRGRRSEASG